MTDATGKRRASEPHAKGPAPDTVDEAAAGAIGESHDDRRGNDSDDPAGSGNEPLSAIAQRFRGFLPVVVDVETGGFNPATDALLEIAAVHIQMNDDGTVEPGESERYIVKPFAGANLEPASLAITGIDPYHPLRPALDEGDALRRLFQGIRKEVKDHKCSRAILVGHNSFFDLQFLNAAVSRAAIKRNPFHPFSSFDTASLAGVAFGQTVLGRAVKAAGLEWEDDRAHSALYDAEVTARLFCAVVNRFKPIYDSGREG